MLQPSSSLPYHFDSSNTEHFLQIKSDSLPYGWSSRFSLSPNRIILQLPPLSHDRDNTKSRLFKFTSDPSLCPSSLLEVEISADDGRYVLVIRPCSVSQMPFCVNNRSCLDILYLRQRGASWDQSLVVMPLQSVMWTLPLCDGETLVDVYARKAGSLLDEESLQVKHTFDVMQMGNVGYFEVSTNRPLTITTTLRKSTRIVVFDQYNANGEKRLSSLLADKLFLVDLYNHLDNQMIQESSLFGQQFDTRQNNSTLIQALYCFSAEGIFVSSTVAKLIIQVDGQQKNLFSSRGNLPYWGKSLLVNAGSKVDLQLVVNLSKMGVMKGVLDLSPYCDFEHCYEVLVPCADKSGVKAFCVLNVANITEENCSNEFEWIRFQQCKEELASVIRSVTTEFKLERSFSRRHLASLAQNSLYLHRATHKGIFKSPSTASPVEIEEASAAFTKQRTLLRVIVHEIKHLSMEESPSVYFTVQGNDTVQRAPSSSDWQSDRELCSNQSVVISAPNFNLGCVLVESNGRLVVSKLVRGSTAFNAGVCVGFVLSSFNGYPAPSTLYELQQRINADGHEKQFVFASIDSAPLRKIVLEQSVVLRQEALQLRESVQVSFYTEKDEGEDEKLWNLDVDVSEETNVEMMVNGACISFETVWESFEEEERVVFDARMNFVGVGVSVINGTPEELLYVSLLGIRSDLKVMNRGKKVIELELNSFQIDNQISGAKYEVLLDTPSEGTWLSATMVIQPHPSLLYLELFSVLMQNVRVFADSGVIMNILSFVQELPFDTFEKIERDCMKQLSESPLFIR